MKHGKGVYACVNVRNIEHDRAFTSVVPWKYDNNMKHNHGSYR